MKYKLTFLIFVLTGFCGFSQIIIIGHPKLNNSKLTNVQISVKEKMSEKTIHTFNTGNKDNFMVEVEFDKAYQICFQHPKCTPMFMEIEGNTVPPNKHKYTMEFKMDVVPFVNRNDHDIDTTVFKDPFFKVIFDGNTKMVEDLEYNNAFADRVLKDHKKSAADKEPKSDNATAQTKEEHSIIVGKILLNNEIPASNRKVYLLGKNNKVLDSAITNRYGEFVFTRIKPSDVALIAMDVNDPEELNVKFMIQNSRKNTVDTMKPANGSMKLFLQGYEILNLVDNDYTCNIGGKLVCSSPREKKFFTEKTVYLSNKFNTVLKKTKTNAFGTFVFEDLQPGLVYYIGVDRADVMPGQKIDMLNKNDSYVATLDSLVAERWSLFVKSSGNKRFSDMQVESGELKMEVKGAIYGDNVNTPIGKLKIILLNDNYIPIDSAVTDDFGTFKFKYLPFLKRFYLSANNTDNTLDAFQNILIYSNDNLIKIMTHQKGMKFTYKPVEAEMIYLREIELEDPWLELMTSKKLRGATLHEETEIKKPTNKYITENILFETAKWNVTPQAQDILDKIVFVLKSNQNLKIEIGAHTDSKGSEASNMVLSEKRAGTVRDYIIKSGVDKKRIISKGYGETKLLNNCSDKQPCSEAEHAQNRRIEFKILEE